MPHFCYNRDIKSELKSSKCTSAWRHVFKALIAMTFWSGERRTRLETRLVEGG